MTSNISSSKNSQTYRLRQTPTNNSSNLTGQISNINMNNNNNNNSSYYGSTTPIVSSPSWSYSSPSQLARKYANITPIWCHITKPRQLKKKFASTFHQAQSLVSFYNEDRAPSERRGSINQSQQQNQNQSQQQKQHSPIVHNTNSNSHHRHHYELNSYRQQYTPHYISHDLPTESSTTVISSSSRVKKKYTGGALTMHVSSSSRLQSPPPQSLPSIGVEEKFSNPSERKARIDQLKDLVFNTHVKDKMVGRTDSKNRSTTNLHKTTSYKRIDQITNPNDDYQSTIIPPTTPIRKESHYYHYHLPTSSITSAVNENLNRPIVPPPLSSSSRPIHNYDYLRAKSKEHTRSTYYEPNYITSSMHTTEMPSTSSQTGSTDSTITNSSNAYRIHDDHGYIGKPTTIIDKNSAYTAITSFPSYQTPSSSKRRIKKYLLAKGSNLSHQTEPITTNLDNLSLHDDEKSTIGVDSSVIIGDNYVMTPPIVQPSTLSDSKPTNTTIVSSIHSTPPIPALTTPTSPPPPPSTSITTTESVVFSTPNGQLSPSPPNNDFNNKIPSVLVVPLSASLTSLNNQSQSLVSTKTPFLECVPSHEDKEQSPSRSIVPPITEDGWEFHISVCACVSVCI